MNWYKGDIAQAVAETRKKNAIFVVFLSGNDKASEEMLGVIEETKIRTQLESEHFVAIRIEKDSESYMQFLSIYHGAQVPSLYFIGSKGIAIQIGTINDTLDDMDQKIKTALEMHLPKGSTISTTVASSSASSSFIAAEKKNYEENSNEVKETADSVEQKQERPTVAETEIVCDGDVCYKKPREATATTDMEQEEKEVNVEKEKHENAEKITTTAAANATTVNQSQSSDLDARLAATRELLAQKRREAVEEEKKQEKERELRRRREGKEIQHMQEWQREKELKDLKENIRRERAEEQQARERIRAQIAADRAERAQRSVEAAAATESAAPTETTTNGATPQPNASASNIVRLQFRLLNGEAKAHTFATRDTIADVRTYVSLELLANIGHKEFTLATVYPRHEFTAEENEKTLLDLGLFPSAVILVITKEGSTPAAIIKSHGGIINIFSTLIWSVLSPVFSVFNYLRGTLFGNSGNVARGANNNNSDATGAQKRANEDSQVHADAAKRRNLERFMTGPSTSRDARLNAQADELADAINNEQKPYRRYGTSNVHRLSDKRKDSDDENATWNGNSTQQQ